MNSVDFLVSAIASAMHISLYGMGDPSAQLLSSLQEKKVLLVLDNFEQLLAGAQLVAAMIHQTRKVAILVTSRERLNLEGEWPVELQGLSFPTKEPHAQPGVYDAVELFLTNANRLQGGIPLSEAQLPAVERICQLVEGMPLGIELAAAWLPVLPCQEIAQEIEKGLVFLARSPEEDLEGHRSMRAVFDRSWKLLSSDEQRVFQQMSIFQGGFRRSAAEQVVGARLKHLGALVEKSLLRRSTSERYDLHELVKQYAVLKLQEAPEEHAATLERHCDYYSAFLIQRKGHLRGRLQREALREIRAEIENVRQAWQWAVSQRKIVQLKQSLQCLLDFYNIQGWFQEGAEAFRLVIEELEDHEGQDEESAMQQGVVRGQALAGLGWFYLASGHYDQASAALQASLDLLRRFEALGELINPLTSLGMAAHIRGDYARSQQYLEESLAIQQATGDEWGEGWTLGNLGVVAYARGEYQEAYALISRGLTRFKALGDQRMIEICSSFLALVACALEKFAEALELSREALALSREIDHPWGIAVALSVLGMASYYTGDPLEAFHLLQESLTLFKSTGETWGLTTTLGVLAQGMCAAGRYRQAMVYAIETLEVSREAKITPGSLDALTVVALIRTAEREQEAAIELLGHPLFHPASSARTRGRAERLLAELEAEVDPEALVSLQARWRTNAVEEIVEKVLEVERKNCEEELRYWPISVFVKFGITWVWHRFGEALGVMAVLATLVIRRTK